jgi:hypothetical protein
MASHATAGTVGGVEDLARVVEPERREVDEDVVVVRHREPDLRDLAALLEHVPTHVEQRRLQCRREPLGEGLEEQRAHVGVCRVVVDPRLAVTPPRGDLRRQDAFARLGERRVAVLRVALESGPGGLQHPKPLDAGHHVPIVAVGDHHGGAHLLPAAHERVVVLGAPGHDPLPGVPLGRPAPTGHARERAREVVGEAQQELLGRADPIPGEREDGVLLRVGRHDVPVVALEMRGGEVPAELRRDAEVVDLVPVAAAGDLDDADLRLAVPVGAEDDGGLGHVSSPGRSNRRTG